MKKLFGLIFAVLFIFSLQGQEVAVNLSKDQIKIGEQTTFEWVLKLPAAIENYKYPTFKDSLDSGIEIINQSKIDTTFGEGNEPLRYISQQITITAWDSGVYKITPKDFQADGNSFQSQSLELKVNNIAVKASGDIKDIKNILDVPFSLWDWILSNKYIIGSCLFGILLLVLAYFIYKKYKKKDRGEKEAFVPVEAADLIAKRKLEELKKKQLWQKDQVKDYYVSLSFILREYISNRYQIHALELTTDEIVLLTNTQLDWDEQVKRKLHQTLLLSDMAKYAKQKPIAQENETAYKNAAIVIEQTAVKEEELEEEEANSDTQKEKEVES